MRYPMFIFMLISLIFCPLAQSETLRVASAAGYKKLVERWVKHYESMSKAKVERLYGNMGQAIAQAEHGDGVCLIIGNKDDIAKSSIKISRYTPIGNGRPVLVTRKGLELKSVEDLRKDEFVRISSPNFKKAIFGKAAYQLLTARNYTEIIKKILQVDTVPRSGAYAITGEVDAAFINLPYAKANMEKFGSMVELIEGFEPIEIVAGVLAECDRSTALSDFLNSLGNDAMRQIISESGL